MHACSVKHVTRYSLAENDMHCASVLPHNAFAMLPPLCYPSLTLNFDIIECQCYSNQKPPPLGHTPKATARTPLSSANHVL